jgi:uncharacterized protein YecE (DUF72 family)
MTKFFIGTSGFSYSHWKGDFYPQNLPASKFFDYYLTQFNTVEINSSFYHLPKKATFKNWYQKTRQLAGKAPKEFSFAVKASRFITHVKKLKDCQEPLKRLFDACSALKEKLAVVLFQMPPSLRINQSKLNQFLSIIPQKIKTTFEFRHPSWFCPQIYQILKKFNSALTIADTPNYPYAQVLTANFTYLRLHGHESLYSSNYSDNQLRHFASFLKKNFAKIKEAYVYFDNDAFGYAPKNAQTLIKILNQ